MFSGRRLLMKVIQAEIMQKPGTRGNTGVCAKQIRHPPGQIGHIQAVHQPVRPEMMCIAAKLLKLRILQDRKNVRHICGATSFDTSISIGNHSLSFYSIFIIGRTAFKYKGFPVNFFLILSYFISPLHHVLRCTVQIFPYIIKINDRTLYECLFGGERNMRCRNQIFCVKKRMILRYRRLCFKHIHCRSRDLTVI